MMKEHPISFIGPMVKALIANRKTQTRRVMKPQPEGKPLRWKEFSWFEGASMPDILAACPYGVAGDRLWVKETSCEDAGDGQIRYRATDGDEASSHDGKWTPSMFMPRWASRITLEIVSVRVERLQAITPKDCAAEGILRGTSGSWLGPLRHTPDFPYAHAHEAFAGLWDNLNEKRGYGWDQNPLVWVLEFRITLAEKSHGR